MSALLFAFVRLTQFQCLRCKNTDAVAVPLEPPHAAIRISCCVSSWQIDVGTQGHQNIFRVNRRIPARAGNRRELIPIPQRILITIGDRQPQQRRSTMVSVAPSIRTRQQRRLPPIRSTIPRHRRLAAVSELLVFKSLKMRANNVLLPVHNAIIPHPPRCSPPTTCLPEIHRKTQ